MGGFGRFLIGCGFVLATTVFAVPGAEALKSGVDAPAGDWAERADPPAEHAMPSIPSVGGDVVGDPENRGSELADPGSEAHESGTVPVVEYDATKLPPPVQAIRQRILDAAESGDPALLRPVMDGNGGPPDLGDDQASDDPVEFLKSISGDAEGREILAILVEVLDAGFVHVDAGTPDEMYVWPYFARYPIEKLTPPQIVELFKLIYAGDWEDMRNEGHYLFYRVGIDPSGKWRYFTAGD
jgi:hypothetical protein